ncbi:MAG: sulfotransferase family 2 domain-containing protein [Pikeienuella sp.]
MISHKFKCVFVHIRKNAGLSIGAMFRQIDPDFGFNTVLNDGVLDSDWENLREKYAGYFKFAVARNPWDRCISSWRYLRSTKGRSLRDVLAHLPQENLLDNIRDPAISRDAKRAYLQHYALEVLYGRRFYKRGHEYRHITRPQSALLVGPSGKIEVDHVVYFEALEAGLREVFQTIGAPFPQMRRNNATERDRNYRTYFDPETTEMAARAFAEDIAFWGYDFETGLPAALR